MAKIPKVSINALDMKNGAPNEIEKMALFVGVGSNVGRLTSVSADSDLEKLFGDSELAAQLKTAKLNAGNNWFAYVYELADSDYDVVRAVKEANQQISVEYVVNTYSALLDKSKVQALQNLHQELLGAYGRRIFFIQAVRGINANDDTWQSYVAEIGALTEGLDCNHVMLVPELMGYDVGALAGRLANSAITVADTPARIKTGALLGLKNVDKPTDSTNVRLDLSHIQALAQKRFTSIMWYPDYDGIYWTKGLTLATEGSDYQLIENVRVVDKVARRVRLKAIAKIGDRSFNSTLSSTESHKTYFADVMREMSISTQIGTEHFPGECHPPSEDSVAITWLNKEEVKIYIKVRPIDCPTDIEANIFLDLKTLGGE